MRIQVHGGKGNIIEYVNIPEAVIKFNAVKWFGCRQKEYIPGVQIAVTVPVKPLRHPFGYVGNHCGKKVVGNADDGIQPAVAR